MKKNLKKFMSFCLAVLISASIIPITVFANSTVLGDIDGDSKVTAADARLTLRFTAKLESLTSKQQANADVDGKTGVTAADARLILRVSAHLDTFKTKTCAHQYVNAYCKKCKQVDMTAITVNKPSLQNEYTVTSSIVSLGVVNYTHTYKATDLKVNIRSNEDPDAPFYVEAIATIDFLHGTVEMRNELRKATGMSMEHIYIYLIDDDGKIYYPENSYSKREDGIYISDVKPLYVHLLEDDVKDVKVYFEVDPGTYTLCFLNGDGDKHWDNLFGL